jgi:hypothetical protein
MLWGLFCVVLLCGTAVFVLVQLLNKHSRWLLPIGGASSACILLAFAMTMSAVGLQPTFAAPGVFVPVAPVRICDTMPGNPSNLSGRASQCSRGTAGTTFHAGGTLTFSVTDHFGVPSSGATAVAVNVTTANSRSAGYFTVFPAGQSTPTSSNLNFAAGQVVSNLVEVAVGSSGAISVYSASASDAVVDLQGYVTIAAQGGAGLYDALASPARICDTWGSNTSDLSGDQTQCNTDTNQGRPANLVGPSHPITITIAGHGGVPATGVSAAVLNVTVADPKAPAYVTVHPAGHRPPPRLSISSVAR